MRRLWANHSAAFGRIEQCRATVVRNEMIYDEDTIPLLLRPLKSLAGNGLRGPEESDLLGPSDRFSTQPKGAT